MSDNDEIVAAILTAGILSTMEPIQWPPSSDKFAHEAILVYRMVLAAVRKEPKGSE